MKTIKAIIERLEGHGISVTEDREGKKLCGYELNTYSKGGVNNIIFIDFRDTNLKPTNAKHFLQLFNQYFTDFDINDEIQMLRQDKRYCNDFTLQESIDDFNSWKADMLNIFNIESTPQQKFKSVVAELENIINKTEDYIIRNMPSKGDSPTDCQRANLLSLLRDFEHGVNGIELEDFEPNK